MTAGREYLSKQTRRNQRNCPLTPVKRYWNDRSEVDVKFPRLN
jgi:hypothetical protein